MQVLYQHLYMHFMIPTNTALHILFVSLNAASKALSLNVFQEYNIGAITVVAFEHAVLPLLQFCATHPSYQQVLQAKALESEDYFARVCRNDRQQ